MGRNQFDTTDEDMRAHRADFERRQLLSPEIRKEEDEARAKLYARLGIRMAAANKKRGRKKVCDIEEEAQENIKEGEEPQAFFEKIRALLVQSGFLAPEVAAKAVLEWHPIDPHFSMAYSEYLKSPLWRRIRRRVVKRDSSQCQLCGEKAQAVHHISYDYQVMVGNRDEDLISLCKQCHRALEFDSEKRPRSVEEKFVLLTERKAIKN